MRLIRLFPVEVKSKVKTLFVFALNMHYLCGLLRNASVMKETKSLYRHAAEWGVPFGICLSAISVSFIYCDKIQLLSYLCFALSLTLPFMTFRLQRQYFVRAYGFADFSALWMMGILAFIFGALIMSLVTYLVVHIARPGWLYEWAQWAIERGSASADRRINESLMTLKNIVDNNLLPRAIEVISLEFWFVSFIGSVLSAVMALVVKRIPVKHFPS